MPLCQYLPQTEIDFVSTSGLILKDYQCVMGSEIMLETNVSMVLVKN